MKSLHAFAAGTLAVVLGAGIAAAQDAKQELAKAIQQLADASNYSWTSTVETTSQFRPGPTEGQTEKDGFTVLSMTFGDNTTEAVLKGDKGVLHTDEGWQTLAELVEAQDGQQNRYRFLARRLQNFSAPAAQARELLDKSQNLALADEAYSAPLSEQGAKDLLTFRRRDGGQSTVSGAKGSVKFWIRDGALAKYEYHLQGTVSFNGNQFDVDRTTTVEIKNVGSTEVNVPAEAKSKLAQSQS